MAARLLARALTAAGFAPYGTVIEAPVGMAGRAINAGSSERFDLVDDLRLAADGGRATLALFRAQPRAFPFAVHELERHALGSQSFVPIGVQRFVIVVAPAGSAPGPGGLAAFITDGRQGVVLAPGTWHHGLLAVEGGDFVVVERTADATDCDICVLEAAIDVTLPA